jgi:hypothetical protein
MVDNIASHKAFFFVHDEVVIVLIMEHSISETGRISILG